MNLRHVLTIFLSFTLLSEVVSFLGQFRSPVGVYGGISYINSLFKEDDRELYMAKITPAVDNMRVGYMCNSAATRFRNEGGLAGAKMRLKKEFEKAYDRSQTVWPIYYGVWIPVIVLSSLSSLMAPSREMSIPSKHPLPKNDKPDRLY